MNNFQLRAFFSLICFSFVMLTACNKAEEPVAPASLPVQQAEAETWERFVTRQIETHIDAHPQWAVVQGRHEYDGQLPDWSRAGIEKEAARLHQARDEAMAFTDDQLSPEQFYQREYLVSRLDQDLFWIEKAGLPFRSPEYYFGWLVIHSIPALISL